MKNKIKVYILDYHQLVRDGLKALFINDATIEIVGDSGDTEEFIDNLGAINADIILLDMFLPGPEGLVIAKEIQKQEPDTAVLMLSSSTEEELIVGAFQSGVNGYVEKDIAKDELKTAILEVYNGKEYISKCIKSMLSDEFLMRTQFGAKFDQSKMTILTHREIEIVKLIYQGLMYKEIADKLNISYRTVVIHKTNILEKLEIRSIAELIKFAVKNKIVEL